MQVLRETRRLSEGGGWSAQVLGEDERARRAAAPKTKKRRKAKAAKTSVKEAADGESDDSEEKSDHDEQEVETAKQAKASADTLAAAAEQPPTGMLVCSEWQAWDTS